MLGILDLRSVGHYKISQGILQHYLIRYYRFDINKLKREKEK